MSRMIGAAAVAGLGFLAACGGRSQAIRPAPTADTEFQVEIRNQNFYSATIYAYRDGYRRRIGNVDANRTRSYAFTWPFPDVRFQIDFLAGGCIFSDLLPIVPGDRLSVIIEPSDHNRASRALCGA